MFNKCLYRIGCPAWSLCRAFQLARPRAVSRGWHLTGKTSSPWTPKTTTALAFFKNTQTDRVFLGRRERWRYQFPRPDLPVETGDIIGAFSTSSSAATVAIIAPLLGGAAKVFLKDS